MTTTGLDVALGLLALLCAIFAFRLLPRSISGYVPIVRFHGALGGLFLGLLLLASAWVVSDFEPVSDKAVLASFSVKGLPASGYLVEMTESGQFQSSSYLIEGDAWAVRAYWLRVRLPFQNAPSIR